MEAEGKLSITIYIYQRLPSFTHQWSKLTAVTQFGSVVTFVLSMTMNTRTVSSSRISTLVLENVNLTVDKIVQFSRSRDSAASLDLSIIIETSRRASLCVWRTSQAHMETPSISIWWPPLPLWLISCQSMPLLEASARSLRLDLGKRQTKQISWWMLEIILWLPS